MHTPHRTIGTLLLLALSACSGSHSDTTAPPPPRPTVTGTWLGVTGDQQVNASLVENSGAVTGSGTLSNTPRGTVAIAINGTWANPVLTVTVTSGTLQPINYRASLAGDVLTGNLTGSGFTGDALILTRQH